MTTWDKRAMERANLFYPLPEDDHVSRKYSLYDLRIGKHDAFVLGAAWQRDQLLTDETIERVGRVFNTANTWHGEYADCGDCEQLCDDLARAVLTAVIGDHDE